MKDDNMTAEDEVQTNSSLIWDYVRLAKEAARLESDLNKKQEGLSGLAIEIFNRQEIVKHLTTTGIESQDRVLKSVGGLLVVEDQPISAFSIKDGE